ncbi:biotin--[acetyl-CoA-carboxylase] ligase [Prescottella equi]|jgi:BirA family transcriptional regulator, biotin operon repressor / biotin---[acetyl-CoA-carboxylase] ligase|uniref:biotin--[biotin carboxyl-carrier protein] ligase n=1 Tax=Rhodococcus hoagii TaxID=43767 RepID=A0AAE5CFJ7_RHOHA|nr:biotin--[acetyl-CoA-carboxylase] ligase [Prescottella equi]MCD7051077.1 biotin--[acetyl-CoA-carboxylase] ligase [Rhodococcus sp. BH2-1]AVP69586.1 biotin--[acetyl-CoA-carboxylase] ligase [Prescottella equi]ERN44291.1 biotin operon repressor [Prescottella equi NBRC 101255 = C 7]MBM4472957.1 biotin--[acetyl-CoA-carboxylase] ligase [Prescottella equi]MBM4475359.1 biotin--[acetyl-CoA-carboxylase] ligase [Prescottella equi]
MWTDLNRPPLDAGVLRRALVRDAGGDPDAFWSRVDVVTETGSTNADLLAAPRDADYPRSVLIAEHQTGGRGRHARPWVSAPRALVTVSAVLDMPGMDLADIGWLPLLAGVAVVDVLRGTAGVDAELKWPNDVLIGGRKVVGILAEVAATAPVPTVVVGIGLNVSLTEDELPVPTATSLLLEDAEVTDRTVLVRAILRELARRHREWEAAGWKVDALAAAYKERCGTLGRRVRAELPGDRELIGTAIDVDVEGRIVIEADGKSPVAVSAGDITHLRAV